MSRRVVRRARRKVKTILAEVPLPQTWCLEEWVDALQEYRGRPIELVEMDYRPGCAVGAWRATPDRDIVVYCAATTVWHQDYIALHEIAHMLLRHRGECVISREQVADRAPDLSPVALDHLLTRVATDAEELAAETVATVILEAATVPDLMASSSASPAQAGRARRVSDVFS